MANGGQNSLTGVLFSFIILVRVVYIKSGFLKTASFAGPIRSRYPRHNCLEIFLEAYFTFYGPASLADAAHFFGISQTCLDHRELHNLRSFDYFGRSYYYKVWQNGANIPELLILGKFDPLLVSYKYKELLIAPDDQPLIWKKAGQISALILIKGQLRATWSMSVKGSAIDFKVQAKQKISQKHQASIRRNFRNYARWMGKKMRKVNFELE